MINLLVPIYLGIVSRICGSHYKYLGLFLYPIPYMALSPSLYWAAAVFGWVFVWKVTGHADGFQNYERDNTLSKIVKLLPIDRKGKLYDAIFWAFKGGLIVLLPAFLSGHYELLLASAVGYPLAYHLGFNYLGMGDDNDIFGDFTLAPRFPLPKILWFAPTVWGEFLAGLFAGLGFLFVI